MVEWRGQVVTMLDRSYLAEAMPVLLVWGAHDAVIPVSHAHIAHESMPGSRLEIFADAGHFPHHQDPDRFLELLQDFIATTEPVTFDRARWRRLLREGRDGQNLTSWPTPAEVADGAAVPTAEGGAAGNVIPIHPDTATG
ncbi:MAG: hypothetical protein U0P45_03805 [Acidimicrobiales bacterium]